MNEKMDVLALELALARVRSATDLAAAVEDVLDLAAASPYIDGYSDLFELLRDAGETELLRHGFETMAAAREAKDVLELRPPLDMVPALVARCSPVALWQACSPDRSHPYNRVLWDHADDAQRLQLFATLPPGVRDTMPDTELDELVAWLGSLPLTTLLPIEWQAIAANLTCRPGPRAPVPGATRAQADQTAERGSRRPSGVISEAGGPYATR